MFKDISHFENVADYLPILNSVLLVDLAGIQLLINGAISSKKLGKWYQTFQLNAVMADVLILVIGIVITRFIYPYLFNSFSLFSFVLLAMGIQIIHDFGFFAFFQWFPSGKNGMMDLFKEYAKEIGIRAVISDNVMIAVSVVMASWLASFSINTNIVLLIFILYLFPYYVSHKFVTS